MAKMDSKGKSIVYPHFKTLGKTKDLYSYDYSQQETITQWYQNSLSQEEANIFTLKEWQTVPIDLVVSRN